MEEKEKGEQRVFGIYASRTKQEEIHRIRLNHEGSGVHKIILRHLLRTCGLSGFPLFLFSDEESTSTSIMRVLSVK